MEHEITYSKKKNIIEFYVFMHMERAMTLQIRHLKFSYLLKLIRLPTCEIKFRDLFT